MNAAIAQHLNVAESAIVRIEEWAHVLFVVCKKLGARFVSKKVVKVEKTQIGFKDAAKALASSLSVAGKKAKFWDKKEGECRIYTQYGYLRIAPETDKSSQVQYFTKSYEISELQPFVNAFNETYTVVEENLPQRVLMQEDEDGIIAPEGQHEHGVHIVREWWVER